MHPTHPAHRKTRHGRRTLPLATAALSLAALSAWLLWPSAPGTAAGAAAAVVPPRISTVAAGPATWEQTLGVSGSLAARDEIAIGTSLPELRVLRVHVEAGESVHEGQLLAELDSTGLQAQARQARSALAAAQAAVREKQARHSEAQANYRRMQPLAPGSVTLQQLDEYRTLAQAALSGLQAAEAEAGRAQAQLAEIRHRLDMARVHAPVSGLVMERHARAGALAGSEPLFRMARDGLLELDAETAEADLATLREGMAAEVLAAGQAGPVNGRLRWMSPRVDAQSRLGRVRIALPENAGNGALRAGSFALAKLQLGHVSAAIALPARAVHRDSSGQASVMLIDGTGHARQRAVTTGVQGPELLEIVSGLQAGERVAATASVFLRDGDTVTAIGEKDMAP